MIVSFHTRELLQQCSSLERAEQSFGSHAAQVLVQILADIEALEHAGELIQFFQTDVAMLPDNSLSLLVGLSHRAVFCAVGANVPHQHDGIVDWTKVQRVKLLEIRKC